MNGTSCDDDDGDDDDGDGDDNDDNDDDDFGASPHLRHLRHLRRSACEVQTSPTAMFVALAPRSIALASSP